jgi:hypothetical protein
MVMLGALYMPMPQLLSSWFSRTVIAVLVSFSLLQIAESLQYLLLPNSGFKIIAAMTVVLYVAILLAAPPVISEKRRVVSAVDVGGFVTAAFFLLPFIPILTGSNSLARIAETSGYQVVDGTHHYLMISDMQHARHFTYATNGYYPNSFHLAVAFIQNTIFKWPDSLSWQANARLYFAQYMFFGVLTAYMIYTLAYAFLEAMRPPAMKIWRRLPVLLLALCLGPVLALLYLLPFMAQGFLNYMYVAAAIAAGLLFLLPWKPSGLRDKEPDSVKNKEWAMVAYLLIAFGAASSWALLLPPLLLLGIILFVPPMQRPRDWLKSLLQRKYILIYACFAALFLPLYLQVRYGVVSGESGVNASGNLHGLHYLTLLVGAVVLCGVITWRKLDNEYRSILSTMFGVFFVMLVPLVVLQYFTAGEIKYYPAKISQLLEIFLLALGVSTLVRAFSGLDIASLKTAIFLPFIPIFVGVLCISPIANPMREARELLKSYSGMEKPAHYDRDVSNYVALGTQGKIQSFNTMSLHFNPKSQKFEGYEQLPYWANLMQLTQVDQEHCNDKIYANLAYGTATAQEQQEVFTQIKLCAAYAKAKGLSYYIITDRTSATHIAPLVNKNVTLVY